MMGRGKRATDVNLFSPLPVEQNSIGGEGGVTENQDTLNFTSLGSIQRSPIYLIHGTVKVSSFSIKKIMITFAGKSLRRHFID